MKFFAPRFSLFVIAFIAYACPAYAAITEDQVKAIKSSFQDLLDYQKEVNDTFGEIQLTYEGELKAEAKDDSVVITFPQILMGSKQQEEKNVIDIGVISLIATPDEKPGLWKTSITVPSSISVKSGEGSDLKISIEKQSLSGVYNQNLGYFVKMDSSLMNITATENDKPLGFNIGKLNLLGDLIEGSDGLLSGPMSFSMENFVAGDEEGSFNAEKLGVSTSITNFKPIKLSDYRALLLKHKETFNKLTELEKSPEKKDGLENKKIADMIFDLYNFTVSGLSFDVSAQNLKIEGYNEPTEAEQTKKKNTFTLADAHVNFSFNGIGTDNGEMSVETAYSGAGVSPMDSQYEGTLPTDSRLGFKIEKLPLKSLYDLTKNTVNGALDNPEMAGMVGMGLLIKIPAMLSQAGSELSVNDNFVKSSLFGAYLDGKVITDLAAATSFTGNFTGRFDGLDELLARFKDIAKKDSSSEASDIVQQLEDLKKYGANTPDSSGKSSYKYDILFTPEGSLTVNGKPFEPTNATDKTTPPPAPIDETGPVDKGDKSLPETKETP